MARKVYWLTLITIMRTLSRYIGRYSQQLQGNLTIEQWACVQSVFETIAVCLAAMPPHEIDD